MSFYDYVNRQRIEHAKHLLKESQSSVIDVACASGYGNKTSFYNAFKQNTGTTPVQYRAQQLSPG